MSGLPRVALAPVALWTMDSGKEADGWLGRFGGSDRSRHGAVAGSRSRCGRKNLIAVRVDGGPGLGGIYRPVVLYTPLGFGEGTRDRKTGK